MRGLLLILVALLVASCTFLLFVKQSSEEVCHAMRELEKEANISRALFEEKMSEIHNFEPLEETEILILIITGPNNRDFRDQLRKESYLTYKWKHTYQESFSTRYFFVCGTSTDSLIQAALRSEAAQHGDLLVGDFTDSYENLVYKTIWLLRYAVEQFQFDYVMKVDDDTFLNPQLLFDFLYKYIKPAYNDKDIGYYGGMIRHGPRDVQREGQWGIEKWEFEEDFLPPYVVGGAYILNHKAARALIDLNSENTMVAFRIEDAYIGALADRIGLRPRDIPKAYSKQYDRFCDDKGGRIFHRVAPSFQVKMIHNWTTLGYYCQQTKSLEEILAAGEELLRKY